MRLVVIFFFICTVGTGAINPIYSEASERGYEIRGDSVIFPDNSICSLEDFNNYRCGQKWFDVDYCVDEDRYVWNSTKCCDGLVPFLEPNTDGQARCVKKKSKKKSDTGNWFTSLINNTLFWVGLLLPFLLLAYVSYSLKKKIKKRNLKDSEEENSI